MNILRWPASGLGRSRSVACNGLVWAVANAADAHPDFERQVQQSLARLEDHLLEAGSDRQHLLSLQVLLTDIANRPCFDEHWQRWIGPDPQHWPQRACFQAGLAPGLQIELIAVAAAREGGPSVEQGAGQAP